MTFSEQIVYAMFKPSKYKELVNLKAGRSVLFIIVLTIVLGIVTFVIPMGALITGFGGFEKLFSQRIGALEYSNNSLSIEEPFEMSFDYNNVLIDTSEESISDEKMDRNGMYIAVGSKNIRLAFVNGSQVMDYASLGLDAILSEGFNNSTLCRYIPAIYGYLFITFLFTCAGFFIKYGFIALVFTIWINSVNKHLQLGLSYGQVFMICFYGQTLGIILSNFNAALGWLPQFIVSLVGVFVSVHMITASVALMREGDQL